MLRRDPLIDALRLRPIVLNDLEALFAIQADPQSNLMAGTRPRTREAFFAKWERNFADQSVNSRVIEVDGAIVGSIARFRPDSNVERDFVGYWIARGHWGRGIASRALSMFLSEGHRRPLYATTLSSNAPSRRVLEKCGFRCAGFRMGDETERFVAAEVADFVLE